MAKRTLKKHRTRTVKIAVTPEQHESWKRAAKAMNESLERFCRDSCECMALEAMKIIEVRELNRKVVVVKSRKPLSPIEMMIDEATGYKPTS